MKNIIFVGGLDNRVGDLNLTQQTDLIIKGYGTGADIASFRYSTATATITKSITDNPGAIIILFSAGCSKSKAIADHLKSINQPLNLLHINEPYTCAPNGTATANQINAAIALGVPKTNVYSGGYDCAGNNISGHTKLVGRTPGGSAAAHFNSLTPLGKLIASLKPPSQEAAPTQQAVKPAPAAQSKSVIATGPGKEFINKFNEELEKVYKEAITSLGPWKKAREEAIKITKLRKGAWPVDPAVKTIGNLFAYVFFDPDGLKFNSPPWFQIKEDGNTRNDEVLQKQYNDWINDMNGAMPLPTSPTAPLVLDPTISNIFKSLAWPHTSSWTGNQRNSKLPIVLPKSTVIIENYNEIKKPGITNPDKYSAGQWWFDMFMSEVIGLNGLYGYLKSKSDGSTNERIEEAFGKSRFSKKFLDNNKKIEGDTNLYTISVSKFVKGETAPYSVLLNNIRQFDRENYTDYGSGDQETSSKVVSGGKEYPGYGFAKILELIERRRRGEFNFSTPPNIEYGGFDLFDSLKTQYRPGVNSLESLSKDSLFNPMRTSIDDIAWTAVGITQSQETGIYWEYPVGTTASVVGNFENILLYNAFLEAGDNYQTITIPKKAPEIKVEEQTVAPLVVNKFSGEFTFNVEKKNTFVVVGNQNFTLKIGDLVIEGLTTSSVIDSSKTIDLGDGIVIIDDGESDEDIYSEGSFEGAEEIPATAIRVDYSPTEDDKQGVVNNTNSLEKSVVITTPSDGSMTISAAGLKELRANEGPRATVYDDADGQSKSSYNDCKGFPTVGVGHLIKNDERATFSKYLKPGKMSNDVMDNLLLVDLESRIKALNKKLKVKVSQNQFDALLSMMFNTGGANKSFLKAVSLTNEGKFKEASDQIRSGPKTSKGKVLPGLVTRRNGEADRYLA